MKCQRSIVVWLSWSMHASLGKKKPKKNVAVSTCSSCTSTGSLVLLVHRCHCHRVHIRHTCSDACVYVRTVAENEGIGLERGALVSKGCVYVYILWRLFTHCTNTHSLSPVRLGLRVYVLQLLFGIRTCEFFRHSIHREDSSVSKLSHRLLMMNKNKASIYLTYYLSLVCKSLVHGFVCNKITSGSSFLCPRRVFVN